MPNPCYLCGNPASKALQLKDSFTAHSLARCPYSPYLCDRCDYSINLRAWYFNPNKDKWVKLFARGWSWIFQGDTLLFPTIEGTRTEGKDTFPIVSNLPTRAQLRATILDPPEPPFTIAIAESGQKHILFLAQPGEDRNHFPVQFELDTVNVNRAEFMAILEAFEALLALEFSKTEIMSGEYRSDRLMKALTEWEPLEAQIASYRGTRLLALVSHVTINPSVQI